MFVLAIVLHANADAVVDSIESKHYLFNIDTYFVTSQGLLLDWSAHEA